MLLCKATAFTADPPSMDEVELAVALGAAATPVPAATNSDDLRFHHVHGHNAIIINGGKTASRPHARGEFNDAIVTSNRPLRDNELFEVSIDKMVDRWSGSIEAGKYFSGDGSGYSGQAALFFYYFFFLLYYDSTKVWP